MKSLILVAHGSRRELSNEEIRALTDRLIAQGSAHFDHISCAFLELAEPSIPDGIEAQVQAGAEQILVLPYFLSAGRHVAEDIPELVSQKQGEHPGIDIRIAPYLGIAAGVEDLLLSIAAEGK